MDLVCGRFWLLQISVTTYVNAGKLNSLDVARLVLDLIPDAVVLVRSGVGITRIDASNVDTIHVRAWVQVTRFFPCRHTSSSTCFIIIWH